MPYKLEDLKFYPSTDVEAARNGWIGGPARRIGSPQLILDASQAKDNIGQNSMFMYYLDGRNNGFLKNLCAKILIETHNAAIRGEFVFDNPFDAKAYSRMLRHLKSDAVDVLRIYRTKGGIIVVQPWETWGEVIPEPLSAAVDLPKDRFKRSLYFRERALREGPQFCLLTMAYAGSDLSVLREVFNPDEEHAFKEVTEIVKKWGAFQAVPFQKVQYCEWGSEESQAYLKALNILSEMHGGLRLAVLNKESYYSALIELQRASLVDIAQIDPNLRMSHRNFRRSAVVMFPRAEDLGWHNNPAHTGIEYISTRVRDAYFFMTYTNNALEARDKSSLAFVHQATGV